MKRTGFIRRRRIPRALIAAFVILLLILVGVAGGPVAEADAYTPEEEAALEELQDKVDELLEALDTEELQAYLDSLTEFRGMDIKETLSSVITGDFALDYSSLWQSALALVFNEGRAMLPAFAVVLAAALLCGILNSAKNGFLQSTMSDIINFVTYIAVGAVGLADRRGEWKRDFPQWRACNGRWRSSIPFCSH